VCTSLFHNYKHHVIFEDNCKRWRTEGVTVRKSRWNAGALRFKCDHGPHTEEFYLRMGGNDSIYDGRQKRSGDASVVQTTPKRRAPSEYEEKDSDEFKTVLNLYTAGHYNYEMEVVDFDNLSDVSSFNSPPRGRGRPDKAINYRSNARVARRNHELTVVLGLAEDERLELVATVREQEKARVALFSSRREMDYLKMKSATLKEKKFTAADKLVEAQEQVYAAMVEASVARDFLRDVIVNNATEITEDAIDVTEMEVDSEILWPKMKRYSPTKVFWYINAFCKGRGKWAQHAKDILNMTPLRYLLIGFVIVFLRKTLFTKKNGHRQSICITV
jgi:hypothetical protein